MQYLIRYTNNKDFSGQKFIAVKTLKELETVFDSVYYAAARLTYFFVV